MCNSFQPQGHYLLVLEKVWDASSAVCRALCAGVESGTPPLPSAISPNKRLHNNNTELRINRELQLHCRISTICLGRPPIRARILRLILKFSHPSTLSKEDFVFLFFMNICCIFLWKLIFVVVVSRMLFSMPIDPSEVVTKQTIHTIFF